VTTADLPFAKWRARKADDVVRRAYADADFDDATWAEIEVPGHWQSHSSFAHHEGPLLYRTSFANPAAWEGSAGSSRRWLSLEGVFYTSDVWFDGGYLGDTEGYFFPHQFEITDAALARSEHVLAVEVACAPQRDRARKRNLTGIFQHWDLLDQTWNPGGLWRPVHVETSGPVRIIHSRVLCRDASPEVATTFVRLVLDSTVAGTARIVARATDDGGAERAELAVEHTLATGENRVELSLSIDNPDLWWPWSRGAQPRYTVSVDVSIDGHDGVSDRLERRVGMRSVSTEKWITSVNGERLFLKGANQGPTRFALGEATPEQLVADVELAKDAGLDFLRLHAHIARPEIYEAADAAGLLLWQDLPLQWGYHRSVRAQARRQAREAVDLLAHHASVFTWCGHNEPMTLDVEPAAIADPRRRGALFVQGLRQQLLPTWNKSVLDHSIKKVIESCDGSRPVVPHSGVLPHLPQLDGTDSHWYFGWYHGEMRDFGRLVRAMPRSARFVTEFGAQAAPVDPPWTPNEEVGKWPHLPWPRLAERYAVQKVFFDRYVPPANYPSYAEWAQASQRYQAELLRFHIETLRRVKYRPCGGFALFCFADSGPGITWSVLDHERRPKLGLPAVHDACRPVIVTADWFPAELERGSHLHLDVHAINDATIALSDTLVNAHLRWESKDGADGEQRWNWTGDLAADDVAFVGTVHVDVPFDPATFVLDLTLSGNGPDGELVLATNRYESTG